jgi:hypothetical protein
MSKVMVLYSGGVATNLCRSQSNLHTHVVDGYRFTLAIGSEDGYTAL